MSLVYDGVVLENAVVKGMPIWDLERIEVLRGPARHALRPQYAGRRGQVRVEEAVAGQRVVGACLLGHVQHDRHPGGFRRRPERHRLGTPLAALPGPERLGGTTSSRARTTRSAATPRARARLQFLFEPTEQFTALLNLHAWDVDGTARIFRANILNPGTSDLVGGFEQDQIFHDGRNSQDIEAQGGMLEMNYDLGSATLTSVTGFESLEMLSRGDIDGGFGAVFAPPLGPPASSPFRRRPPTAFPTSTSSRRSFASRRTPATTTSTGWPASSSSTRI